MSGHRVSEMPEQLTPAALRRICTEEELTRAANTRAASVLGDMFVGADQKRFADALDLALDDSSKSHIFIAGISGPRALAAVKDYITRQLAACNGGKNPPKEDSPYPPDLCCLYNFDDPLKPITLTLPRGNGKVLKERLATLLSDLKTFVPQTMLCDDVVSKQQQINIEFRQWWETKRLEIIQEARKQEILVIFQENDSLVDPISRKQKKQKADYDIPEQGINVQNIMEFMGTQELDELDLDDRQKLLAVRQKWIQEVTKALAERDSRSREAEEKITTINRDVAREVADKLFNFTITPDKRCASYMDKLKEYAINHIEIFNPDYGKGQNEGGDVLLPWHVNLLVDNSEQEGPPIIVSYNVTFGEFVGRIERMSSGGEHVPYTDHTMITAGLVARANHGYLIVDALNVLNNTNFLYNAGSYHALKRIISAGELFIEDLTSAGMGTQVPMRPMPIPIQIKVIMIGPSFIWHGLAHDDPDFLDHFELKAEVTPYVKRTDEEIAALARSLRQYSKLNNLMPFDASGLGKFVEYAGRLADSKQKLSTDFNHLESIAHEASYCARVDQSPTISAVHVRRALDNKFYRSSFYYEHMQEMIHDKRIILPLQGKAVGQMTILTVGYLGDIAIGCPGRMTADWSVGRPGFVSIHREAGLAGEIFKKGELTVQGYLQALFAKRHPLAVNITYTLEQTYEPVDGDSASLALLYAILSALSDIPLRQDIAITGSMSQRGGEVQAIGGVNEKIEGFFDACALTGLTGTQGVIIPKSNVDDLMLNERVVEHVEEGTFAIWAISDVKEGVRILMGKEAGERNADLTFTEGSVYDIVDKRLSQIARDARDFSEHKEIDFI